MDYGTPLLFLGLGIELDKPTGELLVHQRTVTKGLLARHGVDRMFKPLANIVMPQPEVGDGPPTPAELKVLQQFPG